MEMLIYGNKQYVEKSPSWWKLCGKVKEKIKLKG